MTTDRLRSLDSVDPPDQWDDIVARAAVDGGGDLGDGVPAPLGDAARRPHRVLAVAAVLLVVLAVAGGLAIRSGSESDGDRAGDPTELWGRRWQLVRVDVGGVSITTDLVSSDGGAIVLDAQQQGSVMLHVCNQVGGDTSIVDGRLFGREWVTTAMGCGDPLEQLVRIDGTTIDATADGLVLTKPGYRYEFRPVGSLPPEAAIVGRRWLVTTVTKVTKPSPGTTTKLPPGEGPVLDLRDPSEVVVEGCGPATKAGEVVGGRLEVDPGTWQTLMLDCELTPSTEHAPAVQAIIDAGATIERDQHRLVVRSGAGSFVAEAYLGSTVWDLFADWYNPATARWAVVSGSVRDQPRDLIGKPVLTITTHLEDPERTIDLSGCGSVGGEITDLDDEANTIRYRPDLGGVYMGCSKAEGEQAGWITDVLAGDPTVEVVGQRARITSDARSLLLVRLD